LAPIFKTNARFGSYLLSSSGETFAGYVLVTPNLSCALVRGSLLSLLSL